MSKYATMNPASNAPKDGTVFLGLFKGAGWLEATVWNPVSMKWCRAKLDTDLYDGEWQDHGFISEYENLNELKGWIPMPEVQL
jgi:hypothetical protein